MTTAERDFSILSPHEHNIFDEKGSWKAWRVLVCAWGFYLYEYALRAAPSVITHDLMADFGVTSTALGFIISFYYFSYVPLQVPCGVIVDWLGVRRVIALSSFLCAAGTFLFASSYSPFLAQMARFIIGAGSACGFLCCAKVASEWFTPKQFSMIAAISMMMGTLGGISGGAPFAFFANIYGWRSSLSVLAIVGFIIMFLSLFFIQDKPFLKENEKKEEVPIPLLKNLRLIISNPQCWLIGLYGCAMYLPLSAFAELWGVPFLMKTYNIGNEKASLGSLVVFLGMALGCPIAAYFSNILKSYNKVMSWGLFGTLICFSIVFYIPIPSFYLSISILFLGSLFSGGQILYMASAKEIVPPEASATVIGFINGVLMSSGVIFQPLLGWLLDLAWDGKTSPQGCAIYSGFSYQVSFSAVIIALLIGWILLMFVKETYPKESR